MTLEARTNPYRDVIEQNLEESADLAKWLKDNPDARPDIRREKFKWWKALLSECERLEDKWQQERARWIEKRS